MRFFSFIITIFLNQNIEKVLERPNATCQCLWVKPKHGSKSGCIIDAGNPPPPGYKCHCTRTWNSLLTSQGTCTGEAIKCQSYRGHGCNGCATKQCCEGNCNGYQEKEPGDLIPPIINQNQ